jgi:hypothetical protein
VKVVAKLALACYNSACQLTKLKKGNCKMSKFIIMMLRDKEANGATYSLPSSLISSNLDPELHAKLTAIDHKIYSSVEEAESSAS